MSIGNKFIFFFIDVISQTIICSLYLCHHLRYPLASLTCITHLQHSLAALTCITHLQHSLASLTCITHLHHSLASLTCSIHLHHSLAAFTCGAHLRYQLQHSNIAFPIMQYHQTTTLYILHLFIKKCLHQNVIQYLLK